MVSIFALRSARQKCRLCAAISLLACQSLIFAQTPSAANNPDQLTGVDGVIALVQANMSPEFVMKHIKREGKVYNLSTADMVKLQKAGVSEKIIEFMMDPRESPGPTQVTPMPQPIAATSPTEASEPKKEGKRSFFGRLGSDLGERGKRLTQKTVDSAERTADKSAASLEDTANRKVDASQEKVDQTVETKLGTAEQKVTGTQGQNSTQQPKKK